jgi:hypothetical protein
VYIDPKVLSGEQAALSDDATERIDHGAHTTVRGAD